MPDKNRNYGEIRAAENVNPVVNAINQYFRELKYRLSNNKVVTGKYTIPAALLASTGIAPFLTNAAAATTGYLGGLMGGSLVDGAFKTFTGKTFGKFLSDATGLDETPASLLNPGYVVGAKRALLARNIRLNNLNNSSNNKLLLTNTSKNILPSNRNIPVIQNQNNSISTNGILSNTVNASLPNKVISSIDNPIIVQKSILPEQKIFQINSTPVKKEITPDELLKKYIDDPDIIIPNKDLEILRQATPFKYYPYRNLYPHSISTVRENIDYYNPFESNTFLEKGIPEKYSTILNDDYKGQLNQEFIDDNYSLGTISGWGMRNGLRLSNLQRRTSVPIEYKHLNTSEIQNNADLFPIRKISGIPEKSGIKGVYTEQDIKSFTPEQINNFIQNSIFNEGYIVNYSSYTGNPEEDVLNILFGDKNKGFTDVYKQLQQNLKNSSSGQTYVTHSLSTDSYPIVQTILGKQVKKGNMIPRILDPVKYATLNSFGVTNHWDLDNLTSWFKSQTDLNRDLFKFEELPNNEYNVLYDGNNVGKIRKRTTDEIIEDLNQLNYKYFGENYPKVKKIYKYIEVPRVPFITRKNGGKLCQKKF